MCLCHACRSSTAPTRQQQRLARKDRGVDCQPIENRPSVVTERAESGNVHEMASKASPTTMNGRCIEKGSTSFPSQSKWKGGWRPTSHPSQGSHPGHAKQNFKAQDAVKAKPSVSQIKTSSEPKEFRGDSQTAPSVQQSSWASLVAKGIESSTDALRGKDDRERCDVKESEEHSEKSLPVRKREQNQRDIACHSSGSEVAQPFGWSSDNYGKVSSEDLPCKSDWLPEAKRNTQSLDGHSCEESISNEKTFSRSNVEGKRVVDGSTSPSSYGATASHEAQGHPNMSWAARVKQSTQGPKKLHQAINNESGAFATQQKIESFAYTEFSGFRNNLATGNHDYERRPLTEEEGRTKHQTGGFHAGHQHHRFSIHNLSPEIALEALISADICSLNLDKVASTYVFARGLENPGNLCFVNAVLQVLLSSFNFQKLALALISARGMLNKQRYPVLCTTADIFLELLTDSKISKDKGNVKKQNICERRFALGRPPLCSSPMVDLAERFSYSISGQRSFIEQEDADEFLIWLIDAMHQEILGLRKLDFSLDEGLRSSVQCSNLEGVIDENAGDDGWLVKSGKRSVKKKIVSAESNDRSIVLNIFQCKFASSVACSGVPPSVTVCPEIRVSLPIVDERIRSIEDALDAYTSSEHVFGYRPNEGADAQEAFRSLRFEHLPNVLLLHLMRFQYTGGSGKIGRHIAFADTLKIRSSWLSPGARAHGSRYRLIGTLTHHGTSISSGHYTANVLHDNDKWFAFDDSDVYSISKDDVLRGNPYIIVYEKVHKI